MAQTRVRPLTAADILDLWERGASLHPVERDLLVLAVASPTETLEDLAALTLGQRDARLLELRRQTFGPRLNGFSRCPACDEPLEFSLRVADLWGDAPLPQADETHALQVDDLAVCFRLPTSLDLLDAAAQGDTGLASTRLLERCVLEVRRGTARIGFDQVPVEVQTAVARQMAECDPLADILLDLSCTGCRAHWQEIFDPGAFLWTELAAQARRLLAEVHLLARAYGWREADILGMSSQRRRWYVEMVEL